MCTLLNLNVYKEVKKIIDKECPKGFPKEQPDGTDAEG